MGAAETDVGTVERRALAPCALITEQVALCGTPLGSLTLQVNLQATEAPTEQHAYVCYYDGAGLAVSEFRVDVAREHGRFAFTSPPPEHRCIGAACRGETFNVIIHWGARCFFPGTFSYRRHLCDDIECICCDDTDLASSSEHSAASESDISSDEEAARRREGMPRHLFKGDTTEADSSHYTTATCAARTRMLP